MLNRNRFAIRAVLALSLLAPACDSSPPAKAEQALVASANPHADIVWYGKNYTWRREARISHDPIVEEPIDGTAESPTAPQTPEDLAEALRPILLLNGQEYILAEPDVATATAILAGFVAPQTQPRRPPDPAMPSASSDQIESRTSAQIIGGDGRLYLSTLRVNYPFSTNAHYQLLNGSWCTATIIGPHTAATAAHCVMSTSGYYFGDVFGGNACNGPQDCTAYACNNHVCGAGFAPAFDSASPSTPYGTFVPTGVSVPSGWVGGNYSYDYAMLTFSTTFPGWIGTYDTSTGTQEMAGYPQDKDAGHEMWYKSGTVTATTSTRRQHNLDTMHGDSGAALFWTDTSTGNYYLTGINSTENHSCFFWSCSYWNEASRWNSTTYAFFSAGGTWP